MKPTSRILRFRLVNKDIFSAISRGKKKIETRAATERYRDIKTGDLITFVCARNRFTKKVKKIKLFKSISAILRKYKPETINPKTRTAKEAREMWHGFPGYKEKIKKYGLIAIHFK
jgi:ASC-1-like (ASCH) protein